MALSKKMLAIVGVLVIVVVVSIAAAALSGGNTKATGNDDDNDDNKNGGDDTSGDDGATPGAGANVKIIEVESNPAGTDAGNEWVRIKNFGDSLVNVTGWKIYSTGGASDSRILSGKLGANETMMVTFTGQFLDNEGEVVKLYSADNVLVDETPSITDMANDTTTWARP